MKTRTRITIYRHRDCARCARIARFHLHLDWLGRLGVSTDTPPTGPLRMGEVVVEHHGSGRILRGAEAFGAMCRQVPAYILLLPLLWIPAFRRFVDHQFRGCEGGSCAVPVAREIHPRHS